MDAGLDGKGGQSTIERSFAGDFAGLTKGDARLRSWAIGGFAGCTKEREQLLVDAWMWATIGSVKKRNCREAGWWRQLLGGKC